MEGPQPLPAPARQGGVLWRQPPLPPLLQPPPAVEMFEADNRAAGGAMWVALIDGLLRDAPGLHMLCTGCGPAAKHMA